MLRIEVLPVGDLDMEILDEVRDGIASRLGLEVRVAPGIPEDGGAFDPERGQHDSSALLARVLQARSPDAIRVLGVAEVDLFIPMLTFVYGQAQLGGAAAIVSLARLRQEFYGLPPDPELLAERAVKESLHELGHTFGLVHCPDPGCAASLSTHVLRLDAKKADYCRACEALVEERLSSLALDVPETAGVEERT